jgi:hypothetical protein
MSPQTSEEGGNAARLEAGEVLRHNTAPFQHSLSKPEDKLEVPNVPDENEEDDRKAHVARYTHDTPVSAKFALFSRCLSL